MLTDPKAKKKALIIGGGIAGPALALFLKRAGIEAEIYEARTSSEGFSLTLSCNGLAVLQELGLDQAVLEEGSAVSKWKMWNGRGKQLGGGVLAGGGLKSVFIKHVPLGNIILDEVERQGIPVLRGKKLEDMKAAAEGGVVATFQDGTSVSGDYLIGCDGVHSRTRRIIDPGFPGPAFTGLINSGGYTSGVDIPSEPETIHFIFCKRAFFGYHVSPGGFIYWFTNWPLAQEPSRDAFKEMTDAERKKMMLDIYKNDQPFIGKIIQRAETTFPFFVSYALPQQPSKWHKGPIALVGDAAHAISSSSGQGASMALEDVIVLAKCLRDIPNAEYAFATYERLRRERTIKMYDAGRRGDSGKHVTGAFQQWFRDMTTPVFLKLFANPKASDWMYSYRVDWERNVSANG